jgi:hypothetical protein
LRNTEDTAGTGDDEINGKQATMPGRSIERERERELEVEEEE